MPFTVAHAAAALPVRRAGFVLSAFVVGTFGPDFEYFLRLAPRSKFGHQWPGVLLFTIPACVFALWLFHSVIKRPAASLMPRYVERRLEPYLGEFRFRGARRFGLIVLSVTAGIGTHLFWDSFTHQFTWATRTWPLLLEQVTLPALGVMPVYKVLQHASTVLGLTALAVWFFIWLRTVRTVTETGTEGMRASRKSVIVSTMAVAAAGGASVRTFALHCSPADGISAVRFIAILGVTAIAFFLLELFAYSVWWTFSGRLRDSAGTSL